MYCNLTKTELKYNQKNLKHVALKHIHYYFLTLKSLLYIARWVKPASVSPPPSGGLYTAPPAGP